MQYKVVQSQVPCVGVVVDFKDPTRFYLFHPVCRSDISANSGSCTFETRKLTIAVYTWALNVISVYERKSNISGNDRTLGYKSLSATYNRTKIVVAL